MWDFLRDINRHGTTIILTTHYLEEAENLCRNIAIIDKGGIIERDHMSSLLRRLNTQTFVLNTRSPLLETPAISQFNLRGIVGHTPKADIAKEQNLNELFAQLSRLGVEVLSMRNKVNRLEEIFMRLVENRTGNV